MANIRIVDLHYAVVLEPEDGAYNVIVPALPEAHTWGESVEHALEMAREVIQLVVEERISRGEYIPPSDVGAARLEAVTVTIPTALGQATGRAGESFSIAPSDLGLRPGLSVDNIGALLEQVEGPGHP